MSSATKMFIRLNISAFREDSQYDASAPIQLAIETSLDPLVIARLLKDEMLRVVPGWLKAHEAALVLAASKAEGNGTNGHAGKK